MINMGFTAVLLLLRRKYDKNPTHLGPVFWFVGATFRKKMNQSVTKTRDPNVWGSYRISDFVHDARNNDF